MISNAFDIPTLLAEWQKIPAPKQNLIEAIDRVVSAADGASLGATEISPITKFLKELVASSKVRAGAWRFLQPDKPVGISGLDALQVGCGMEYIRRDEFVQRLRTACQALSRARSPLFEAYVNVRVQDLEFAMLTATAAAKIRTANDDTLEGCQRLLMLALAQQQAEPARRVVQLALANIVNIARTLLAPERRMVTCDSNFMLVLPGTPKKSRDQIQRYFDGVGARGGKVAGAVWGATQQTPPARYFYVMEQDCEAGTGPDYRGFWVPDVQKNGNPIPGAPWAAYYGKPCTVHTDRLPKLPMDDALQTARWQDYLRAGKSDGFMGKFWLSIPVLSENEVRGVVNVNVRDTQEWPRASSEPWMEHLAVVTRPWLTLAYNALAIAWENASSSPRPPFSALAEKNVVPRFRKGDIPALAASVSSPATRDAEGSEDDADEAGNNQEGGEVS